MLHKVSPRPPRVRILSHDMATSSYPELKKTPINSVRNGSAISMQICPPLHHFDVKNPFRARYELSGWSWKTGHLSTKLAIFILLMDLGILFSALCMTTNSVWIVWKNDLRDCRENICENVSTQPTGSSEEQHQNAIWKQKRPQPLPFKPPHRPIKMSTTIRSTKIQRFPNVCSMVFQNK